MTSLFAIFLIAQTAAPGSWKGSITIDGKAKPVQFVCAYEKEDAFDEKKVKIRVVFAFAPPAGEGSKTCKAAEDQLMDRLQKDGESGLVARLSPAPDFVWDMGYLFANANLFSYSFSGTEVMTKIEAKEGGILTGRLWTNGEAKVINWPTMNVDATFSVQLQKLIPKSPAITGAEALRHPAVISARKFLTAMTMSNLAEIRARIVEGERASFDEMMSSPNKSEALTNMKEMAADALKLPGTSVSMRGDLAEVTFERTETNGSGRERARFQLRQEQGEWRVTRGR